VPVDIELGGTLTRGMTVADFRGPGMDTAHTRVGVTLDHPRFWALVEDSLLQIGEPSQPDV
jgi:purine nucleosidase